MTMKTQSNRHPVNGGSENEKRGFSLIELVVAMAVMLCLMGALTPALNGLGKSGSLNGGGELVANLLSSARQNSLSKNAMTALVMVTDPDVDNQHRMFTMLELRTPRGGALPTSSDWKQIAKWEILANGIVVNNWSESSTAVSPALPSVHCGNRQISQFKSIIFMPDGSTYNDSPATFELIEGFFPRGASTPLLTGRSQNGEAVNYYKLTVLNSTGRVKIERP